MRTIFPGLMYSEVIVKAGVPALSVKGLGFNYVTKLKIIKLSVLLPPIASSKTYHLRKKCHYIMPSCRNDRFKKSFINM